MHSLTLQHELLALACWSRCRKYFYNDDDVAFLVMRLVVILVTRYLGPRGFKMNTPDTFLKRTYFRMPGKAPFLREPTRDQVMMVLFLNALEGRIR